MILYHVAIHKILYHSFRFSYLFLRTKNTAATTPTADRHIAKASNAPSNVVRCVCFLRFCALSAWGLALLFSDLLTWTVNGLDVTISSP